MSTRTRAFIAILFSSVLWGTAGITGKLLVANVDPFVSSFYRFFIASVFILPFFLKEKPSNHVWRDLLPLSFIGALNVPFFYLGLTSTTANSAAMIYTAIPLVTAVLSSLLIKEIHSKQKLIGIIIGLIGALLITLLPLIEKGSMGEGSLTGNIVIICAMLSWTLYSIGSHRILIKGTYSPLIVTSVYFIASTCVSLVLSLITNRDFLPIGLFTPIYLGTLFYSSIFITLIPYFLFQWASKRTSITTVSLKQYIELMVAIVLNTIILREILSSGFVIGGMLVILGVVIATGSRMITEIKKKLISA